MRDVARAVVAAQDKAFRQSVWTVLVEECGARESQWDEFAHHYPQCREFRFQGLLGFGGKVYATPHQPYLWVDFYPEDWTAERAEARSAANWRLAQLAAKWKEVLDA